MVNKFDILTGEGIPHKIDPVSTEMEKLLLSYVADQKILSALGNFLAEKVEIFLNTHSVLRTNCIIGQEKSYNNPKSAWMVNVLDGQIVMNEVAYDPIYPTFFNIHVHCKNTVLNTWWNDVYGFYIEFCNKFLELEKNIWQALTEKLDNNLIYKYILCLESPMSATYTALEEGKKSYTIIQPVGLIAINI